MPGRPPRQWFKRITPGLKKTYPKATTKQLTRVAAGIWHKTQPRKYLYDPKNKISKEEASYVREGKFPFVCGTCRYIRWGGSGKSDTCDLVTGTIDAYAVCRLWKATYGNASLSNNTYDPQPKGTVVTDPGKLPEPDDHPGYDDLNNIRLVSYANAKGYNPVKNLIEAQVVMPQHQFKNILDKVRKWKDVEITDEDNDGTIDRIIRRARDNKATNIFIDRA